MKIIFFGSGEFAVKSIESLLNTGNRIELVVTQPDRPKGRHLELCPTRVKLLADKFKINIFQPENPNTKDSISFLKSYSPDIFIVISYGHILGRKLLEIPKLYPVNVHASLLPKYRGAAPINWAIINGEKQTGISIIRMNEKMDAGDIILDRKIDIDEDDDAISLEKKLSILAAEAIVEAVELINKGSNQFRRQDDSFATLAPKLKKGSGLIDWNECAESVLCKIRGLIPWPGAFTYYNGKLLKIWRARFNERNSKFPGEILELGNNKLVIGCGEGSIEIYELQFSSEKRLSVGQFVCGHKLDVGSKLG